MRKYTAAFTLTFLSLIVIGSNTEEKFNTSSSQTKRSSKDTVIIEPNEVGLFGYGSLASRESMEKTLGKEYKGIFRISLLYGYERNWYAAIPNNGHNGYSQRFTVVNQDTIVPEHIHYLNIMPRKDATVNGCLFVIDSSEIQGFDKREWLYSRVEISDSLDLQVIGGPVFAYSVKECFYDSINAFSSYSKCAIRQSYIERLNSVFHDLGQSYMDNFIKSTVSFPKHLLIIDQKKNND